MGYQHECTLKKASKCVCKQKPLCRRWRDRRASKWGPFLNSTQAQRYQRQQESATCSTHVMAYLRIFPSTFPCLLLFMKMIEDQLQTNQPTRSHLQEDLELLMRGAVYLEARAHLVVVVEGNVRRDQGDLGLHIGGVIARSAQILRARCDHCGKSEKNRGMNWLSDVRQVGACISACLHHGRHGAHAMVWCSDDAYRTTA